MEKVGLVLIIGGILTALGFFLEWFLTTSVISLGFRIAIGVVIVGIVLVLISLGWERYKASKEEREKFREVER
jgi:formate hydrogenlyase subunit 3/multisubunit Na+/H+ antiporter MnhD subunit